MTAVLSTIGNNWVLFGIVGAWLAWKILSGMVGHGIDMVHAHPPGERTIYVLIVACSVMPFILLLALAMGWIHP